jgi:hypothetical protein
VSANDRLQALDAGRRRRSPACASDLVLDRLALGELDASERPALEAHLAGCADCAAASARLTDERTAFARDAAIANLATEALARSRKKEDADWGVLWKRFFLPLGVVATMAAISIFTGVRSGTRTKGEFSLSPYVLHPESRAEGALHLGEPLHPGDRLQFRYNGTKAGHLTIVAIDEAGKVSLYYPPGPTSAPVGAGHDVPLSTSVELDGTLGREVIVGVRCDVPVAVESVVEAARRAVESAKARGAAATALGSLGLPCAETRHQIAKQPRPGP